MKKTNLYTILIIAAVVIAAASFAAYKTGLIDLVTQKKCCYNKTSMPPANPQKEQSDNTDSETEKMQTNNSEPNDTEKIKDTNDTQTFADSNEPNDSLEALNLKDVPAKDLIKKLADWTGKVIIASDEVMQQKITIYSPKRLTRQKALAHIYSALYTKGIIAEQTDDTIYLKPIANAKLGAVPTVPAETPLASIEDKSQIVQKFFKLQNYSPARMSEIILPLVGEYGYVTADENAKTLLVIDTVENLIRLERIITQFDIPEAEQTITKIFNIQTADPVEIVNLLKMLLGQTNYKGTRARPPSRTPSSPKNAKTNEIADSVVIETTREPIVLVPLLKQKSVIAKASAEDMKLIESWISELDKEGSSKSKQTIIQLKYADAKEVASIVQRSLNNMPVKTNVVVEPLTQSKQLVVFGSDENRDMVEKLVQEIDFPATDIFKEKTFKLKHADPDKIKENIDSLYEGAGNKINTRYYFNYGRDSSSKSMSPDTVKVISYSTLDQITVIASAENMEKIEKQIAEWDVPIDVEKVKPRIIELHNSDPVRMADLLQTLFSEKSSSRRNSFFDYIFGGSRSNEQKKIVGALYGQMTFEPVPDTKKIIVISNIPEAYDVVEDLIHQLDSMEVAELPMVVILNYADAEDLCEQLNAILNEAGTPAALRRSKRGLSDYSTDASGQKKSEAAKDDSTTSNDLISPWWNKSRNKSDEEMPTSNLIGKIRFIPVHRSKAILVLAPSEYLQSIKEMIQKLDQPGKQVMVKAIIIEIDHDSMTSLGVRLSSNPDAFGAVGKNALSAFTQFTQTEDRGGAFNLGNIALKQGATSFLNINTFVDLLIQKTGAKILNQPTLWTKDNEEADFFKGGMLPFLVSSNTSAEGTATKDQVEYRPVGVTLRVRPNITPEKAVDMTINLIISQIDTANSAGARIATTELNTTTHMIVNDGETIMLGGILFQTDNKIEQKLPLLGDLPLFGGLFRHYDTELANDELIAFITPYVVDDKKSTATTEQLDQSQTKLQKVLKELSEAIDANE